MADEILTKVKRLMYLINELDKGSIKLSSLASELSVSPRTLQRDIQILDTANFAICSPQRGIYSFVEGHSLQRMQLTNKEAAMLALFSDITCSLGKNFESTYDSLRKRIIQQNSENPFYVKIQKGHSYTSTEITKTIEEAVNNSQKLCISYEGSKQNDAPISPLKIVWFDGYWYLLALGRKDVLLKLRLEKIKKAECVDKFFKEPAQLNKTLDESTAIWFENKRNERIELLISAYASKYFQSRNYLPKQKFIKTLKTGDCIFECYVNKYEEILPTILGWIPHIIIQSPQKLKNIIDQKIKDYIKLSVKK
jgi:predicted DNA-binding transcriptional regulator YafY